MTKAVTNCNQFQDWLSQAVPFTSCVAVIGGLSIPGSPYTAVFGSRTSDNPNNYAFADVAIGLNDSSSAACPVETRYSETRVFTISSHSLAEESDIINESIPNGFVATVSPYRMIGGTPIIVNK